MSTRIPVFVYACDPVYQTGLAGQLRGRPEVQVVDESDLDSAEVAVVGTDEVDEEIIRITKAMQRNGCPRILMVASHLDDQGMLSAVESGVCGMLRRSSATAEALVSAIRSAAAGDGSVPPDLLGRLLDQVGKLQRQVLAPRGLSFNGFTDREVEVLRLVADGLDTAEIAKRLSYSERTIKNVIQGVTMRLGLRNRVHAVAYAVREGLI